MAPLCGFLCAQRGSWRDRREARSISCYRAAWLRTRTDAMVGSPSAPVLRVRHAVDHRAGREECDDQPEDAARDNVHNHTHYGGDDHAYGYCPEELTRSQSEPSVGCTAGGLVHTRLLPAARVCAGCQWGDCGWGRGHPTRAFRTLTTIPHP